MNEYTLKRADRIVSRMTQLIRELLDLQTKYRGRELEFWSRSNEKELEKLAYELNDLLK